MLSNLIDFNRYCNATFLFERKWQFLLLLCHFLSFVIERQYYNFLFSTLLLFPYVANNVSINSNIIVKTKPNMILSHEWDCYIIVNKGKTFLTRLEKHRFARTIVTVLFASASFSLIEMSTIMLRMIPISAKDISMKTSLKIVNRNQVRLA